MLISIGVVVPAAAQDRSFEVGGHAAIARSGEFDATDAGVGARLAWRPSRLIGVEAEATLYPGDLTERPSFTRRRVEGLFGVTVGPRIGPLRVFGKVRPGFVRFGEAPEPIACIAIFPPPLACTLADGSTRFALDLGGGVEIDAGRAAFVRVDLGDRLVRYPSEVIDRDGRRRTADFFSHDLRVAVGAGWRF